MFTRVVEGKCKPGKTNEFCSTVTKKVLPILQKQQGFQDEIVLVSSTDPSQVLMLSFWNTREDAERYHREQFTKIGGDGATLGGWRSCGESLRCEYINSSPYYAESSVEVAELRGKPSSLPSLSPNSLD